MRRSLGQDRLYPVVVIGFLAALVALGLIGVPALLVAGLGAAFAAVAIFALRGFIEGGEVPTRHPANPPRPVARQYVPSVLEGSSMRRRRSVHLHRHRHPKTPLRFR